MNNDPLPPKKQLAGFRHSRVKSIDGTEQENYILVWKDGTETKYSSFRELPARYQKLIRKLEKKAVNQNTQVVSSTTITRDTSIKRRGGNRFRLRWQADPDKLVVRWPTLGHVGSWGVMLIIMAGFFCIDFYEPFTYWSAYPTASVVVVIVLAGLGFLGIASAFVLEERFQLHSNRVTMTRWPSFLKPAKVRPRKDVINARIELRMTYESCRRTSSVYVRVRTPSGIDWWELGGSMRRGDAQELGYVLGDYMPLDTEDHLRDNLQFEIRF